MEGDTATHAPRTIHEKGVALVVVLAQIGYFVPADHAEIPVRDRLLSREQIIKTAKRTDSTTMPLWSGRTRWFWRC